ncbi:MAG: ABC transporter permease [Rhodoferax sp.]|nr:ABC transporter permease [Betaproteobacteria bacterium]NCN97075.1 ABC transporter permease [Rhodoferax sp.]OIP17080.1 MAG: sugar ABC transporter permease [Comamonadaceae bacterium CG2_30_57_122]PIZ21782.1 MAG: sugar ABC transporter permease [Comamonadaceae bacterium CG_4_10_14_0_8_um_filter_57_29]NCP80801.1 ABC transporter permease [Rhodoferax sp.]
MYHVLWVNRQLITRMSNREIVGRYRGSIMGLMWSFLTPLFMLAIYTFVFSVVFRARWGTGEDSKTQFAIILFAGLIIHTLFSDVINRAPKLVLENVNYVKKVVFPVEILPVVQLVTAAFHALVSVFVLLAVSLVLNGAIPTTAIWFPLVVMPLLLLTLGLSWALASLGVYMRDIGQTIGLVTSAMLFLSPVFFPIQSLPPSMQSWMHLNPLTFIIEQSRAVLVRGHHPNWGGLLLYALVATVVAWLGFAWFQKTRKGFADVL